MKVLGVITMSLLFLLFIVELSAETYRDATSHYTITFSDDWKRKESPESPTDLILLCMNSTCGKGTNLDIGVRYFPQLRAGSTEDFLKQTNGERLTRYLRQLPEVAEFKIVHEGRTTLGAAQAYEVVMELRYGDAAAGRRMIRHILATFDRGNVYKASFSSDPEHYEHDFALARSVLATFAIQR